MDIEFKNDSVCFADGRYWSTLGEGYRYLVDDKAVGVEFKYLIGCQDFQLNNVKKGDYINKSEIATEDKCNLAVEMFGLFGFVKCFGHTRFNSHWCELLLLLDETIHASSSRGEREITFNQLMAIGELKRLEIERDKSTVCGKPRHEFVEAIDRVNELESEDAVNKPSHYQFFEGVEVIEIIASSMTREQFKGYCLGNRIKYRLRAGNKDKLEQEIAKSDKYVDLYDEHKHLCK